LFWCNYYFLLLKYFAETCTVRTLQASWQGPCLGICQALYETITSVWIL